MGVTVIEELPKKGFLKFRQDQLFQVRKLFNLEKPGRVKEAIELLREWLEKQDHFNKKDFSDVYLELLLITSKGSVERAKSRIDKLCTYRTIWPHFFTAIDVYSFKEDFKTFNSLILPEVTEDYSRVNIFKINSNVPLQADLVLTYIKFSIILCEYCKLHDYPSGFIIVLDYQDVNLLDLLAILSPAQLQQMINLYMEGFGMRIRGIHLVTTSKVSDHLIMLLKQVLSKKLSNRIHVHRNHESLYDFIPKKILPADYGGDAVHMSEMRDDFFKELSTKEHMEYMKEIQSATVDLKKKPKDSSIDEMVMTGSFRSLSVD
ncbi:alpha-tocopherol transfer protein-like [Cydia strobilella]|uniref:alpha-tocopherol transfer protein-like n=1 Tax=Cydia strobilella TaxID=1100964 RepID=UPI00300705AE